MKNIEETWNNLSEEISGGAFPLQAASIPQPERSRLVLSRIRKKLLLGIMWTLVFLIAIIPVAIIHSDNRDILILAVVAFLLMSSSLPAAIACYRKIGAEPQVSRDSKTMLTTYYKQMVRVLRLERVWSQFSIPAYLVIGLVYSQILRYGSFGEIQPEPRTIIVAAVLMVIVVPLVILWVGWSQKVAYREDLAELKAEIEGLSPDYP